MPSQRFFELEQLCCGGKWRSWPVSHILWDLVHTQLVKEQAIAVTVRNNYAFLTGSAIGHGSMVSFNTSQLFHDDSNGCWVTVPLELTFIASAVVTRMRMRCYGHMAHGTSPLYTSVRSLRDLHSLGPSALGCVNSIETCTSVYNLHVHNKVVLANATAPIHTCTSICTLLLTTLLLSKADPLMISWELLMRQSPSLGTSLAWSDKWVWSTSSSPWVWQKKLPLSSCHPSEGKGRILLNTLQHDIWHNNNALYNNYYTW